MSDSRGRPVNVLFVCLGNICRSTMAQGVLMHVVEQRHLQKTFGKIDSCGTASYHVGSYAKIAVS